MRWLTVLSVGFGISVLGSCGKSQPPASDAAPSGPTTGGETAKGGDDAGVAAVADAGTAPAGVADAAGATAEDAAEDPAKARLELLSQLEIAGLTRSRSQLQNETVMLQFDSAPNAKGNVGSVELTVSACRDCAAPVLKDFEARREQIQQQLGELHAKSPGLVLEIKDFELMAQRSGVQIYSRSFIDDGTTRASVHMLEVNFVENGFAFRFHAYPRSGFPASADELAAAFTREELEALVRTTFKAASEVLWPPVEAQPK